MNLRVLATLGLERLDRNFALASNSLGYRGAVDIPNFNHKRPPTFPAYVGATSRERCLPNRKHRFSRKTRSLAFERSGAAHGSPIQRVPTRSVHCQLQHRLR